MEVKKFCKFCGEQIQNESIVCPKCGRQVKYTSDKQESKTANNEVNTDNKPKFYEQTWFMWVMLIFFTPIGIFFMWKFHSEIKKNTKIILSIIFTLLFLTAIVISGNNEENSAGNTSNSSTEQTTNNEVASSSTSTEHKTNSENIFMLGDTFEFDNLEITLGKDITYTTVTNQFSEYNGMDVIQIPITVKNLKNDTHGLNMFYYKAYGSQGSQLKTVSSFFDDGIDFAGDLRTGASYTKNMYFLYDGNGKYTIEFKKITKKIIVEFNIQK